MVTLYLLRHAKTRVAIQGMADFERALTARGMRDAGRMGARMRDLAVRPELILCSQARRARETLAGIIGLLEGPCRIEIDKTLYSFDAEVVRRRLARLGVGPAAVLVIGHNPALEELASVLAGSGDKTAQEQLHRKFPTCAFAELSFETEDWRTLKVGMGHLARVMIPGDD